MVDETFSYHIDTEVSSNYMRNLMDFIHQKYLRLEEQRFANISKKTAAGNPSLTYTVLDSKGKQSLNMEIRGSKPIELKIIQLDPNVSEEGINEAKEDVVIAVNLFEEKMRKSTIYFAWREGAEIVPEKLHGKEGESLNRLFLETQIFFFMLFITIGIFLFQLFGGAAPLILLALQLIFVLYSNKLIARSADWHITENNPNIHLVEYHLPLKEQDKFQQTHLKDKLMRIKKEIYEETLAKKIDIDCETAHKILTKYGVACKPENFSTKCINVYQLVKKTADIFSFPMPEVIVTNTMMPNAAASGPSPKQGIVLITTGLLVQLEENEILSVLGHEFGHLKGRDPRLLYGLTGVEFLFGFYVLLPLFPFIFSTILFLVYYWAVMTIIFFIAKFFEARADLVSAIMIGQPQVLAEALEKIGFRRLLDERVQFNRAREWISLEPHPPIYFRVNRLEKLNVPVKTKYPLIQSAKDVTHGFLSSL
jgi:heat shock protein HtpX